MVPLGSVISLHETLSRAFSAQLCTQFTQKYGLWAQPWWCPPIQCCLKPLSLFFFTHQIGWWLRLTDRSWAELSNDQCSIVWGEVALFEGSEGEWCLRDWSLAINPLDFRGRKAASVIGESFGFCALKGLNWAGYHAINPVSIGSSHCKFWGEGEWWSSMVLVSLIILSKRFCPGPIESIPRCTRSEVNLCCHCLDNLLRKLSLWSFFQKPFLISPPITI